MAPLPTDKIDLDALNINKLTLDQIKTFPDAREVINRFVGWIDQQEAMFSLLGHNVEFDRKFLYALFCKLGMHTDFVRRFRPNDVCTLSLAREVFKSKSKKPEKFNLGALCKHFDIKLDNAHDALHDIFATYELYEILRSMKPQIQQQNRNLTYLEKRDKYLDRSYIMFNAEGDVYINTKATKDPDAMKFISEELYNLYGN